MQIFIPSRARASRQKTWHDLPSALQDITKIVVYENEERAYRDAGYDSLWVIPQMPSIGPKRQYIMDNAKDDHIVMMDDDIGFLRRKSGESWQLRSTDREGGELSELFKHMDDLLTHYAHVGVSMREGNNRLPTPMVNNQRYCRVLAYNRKIVGNCSFTRVPVMEDFDVNLQLLTQGWPSAIVTDWAQGQGTTNDPGGCSEFRTHQIHESGVMKMAELWPNFVRIREKHNKSGGDFGHRKELTVYWKRAFESGAVK